MKKKLIAASVLASASLALGSLSIASADDNGGKGPRGEKLAGVLSGLVTKGTLTQAQVDAITKALADARTASQSDRDANRAAHLKVITDTLGITAADLKTRLDAGDSLATIAGAKKDALIAAMVAFESKEIDADLAAGKLTADQATKLKAGLKDRVTAQVERAPGMGRDGMGRGDRGRDGMGPDGMGPKEMGKGNHKGDKGMGPHGDRGPRP